MGELPLVEEPVTGDCVACGMPLELGDAPTTREGQAYCCEDCANGHDCTCTGHTHGGAIGGAPV